MTSQELKIGTTLKDKKNPENTWFVFGISKNKYIIQPILHFCSPKLVSEEFIKQKFFII